MEGKREIGGRNRPIDSFISLVTIGKKDVKATWSRNRHIDICFTGILTDLFSLKIIGRVS